MAEAKDDKGDPKTTTGGVVGALGIVLVGIGAMTDSDPNTVMDMQATIIAAGVVMAALSALFSGFFAKDK